MGTILRSCTPIPSQNCGQVIESRLKSTEEQHTFNRTGSKKFIAYYKYTKWYVSNQWRVFSRALIGLRAGVFPHFLGKKLFALAIHWFGIYQNNYSPHCRWRVVDITSTSVNNKLLNMPSTRFPLRLSSPEKRIVIYS